ncbi:MerR family transcriptional regulator [Paenibacillus radicis (ex Gao et al. 2016)]|uniref:Transcriptional regulator n=1 Tax=Paenibacillus radicis (ex Gao et al. 2016) TaxID=1737354 RepID=A0A917M0W9_9BACL|nr:MerR family transcriptional regulator [Paenibacillus radicis (ex Gao et al. 2016)]GGG68149.1 transcriptional regulator [Paenibacillus radicis (ex Gao et al. 2016)]
MKISIGEAAERLGCPAHTIRYYEKEGLLPFIQRDEQGNRIFAQSDLDWIKLLTCFRATGMKLIDLKKIVDLALEGDETIPERKLILMEHQKELQKKQKELDQAFAAITHKINSYDDIERERTTTVQGIYMEPDCVSNN